MYFAHIKGLPNEQHVFLGPAHSICIVPIVLLETWFGVHHSLSNYLLHMHGILLCYSQILHYKTKMMFSNQWWLYNSSSKEMNHTWTRKQLHDFMITMDTSICCRAQEHPSWQGGNYALRVTFSITLSAPCITVLR